MRKTIFLSCILCALLIHTPVKPMAEATFEQTVIWLQNKLFWWVPQLTDEEKKELSDYLKELSADRLQILKEKIEIPAGFKIYENEEKSLSCIESWQYLLKKLRPIKNTSDLKNIVQQLPLHQGFYGQQTYLYTHEIEDIIDLKREKKSN